MSGEFEKAALSDRDITMLWNTFTLLDVDRNDQTDSAKPQTISLADLGQMMQPLGHALTEAELHHLIQEVDRDRSGTIEFEEFRGLMVSRHGDRSSRLTLAFSVLDEDSNGQISADELRQVMHPFGLTDTELDEMIQEVDRDGDRAINFEEFCQLVAHESASTRGYKDRLKFSNRSLVPDQENCSTIPHTEPTPNRPHSATGHTTPSGYVAASDANRAISADSGCGLSVLPQELLCQSRDAFARQKFALPHHRFCPVCRRYDRAV